jgi:hypothetical protein
MKIKNILFALTLTCSAPAFSDNPENTFLVKNNDSGAKCFDENSHIINVGIGLWTGNYYNYNKAAGQYYRSPAFSLSYEQPWPKRIGPGYLGVGAYLGYETERYTLNYYSGYNGALYHADDRWNHFMITGRAVYHWDVLNSAKAEVYAGVLIGLRFNTYNYEDNDPYQDNQIVYNRVNLAASAFAGARYYFTKNFGVYAELGYGISVATVGVSLKF